MRRYEEYTGIMIGRTGKRRYETMYYPQFEYKETDIYIIAKSVTRLDILADRYYGDPRLWVVIARANKLNNATLRVKPGVRIRIPFPVDNSMLYDLFTNAQF